MSRRLLIALLFLSGCRFGPGPMSSWDGCLQDGAVLEPDRFQPGSLRSTEGQGTVLVLETDWGDLPFITDDGQFASLVVELPADLEVGRTYNLDERDAMYREGGQILSYDTRTVTGQVKVLHDSPEQVVLAIDATATAPLVDRGGEGDKPLKAQVSVPRRAGATCREPS